MKIELFVNKTHAVYTIYVVRTEQNNVDKKAMDLLIRSMFT